MPFPKGVKKVAAVFDRADVVITATERMLGLLGIIDDEQAVILGKLEEILAKREFSPVPGLGWDTLSEALTDLWQQITNTHGSVNSYGGTMVDYLSQNQADVASLSNQLNNIGDAVGDTWARTVRYLARPGEGNYDSPTVITGSGSDTLPEVAIGVQISLTTIPATFGQVVADIPLYQPLGWFAYGQAGRWAPAQTVRWADNWFPLTAGADHYWWALLPGIEGTVRVKTAT